MYQKEMAAAVRQRLMRESEFSHLQKLIQEQYGISSSYLGFKYTDGQRTGRLSLVCAVPRKKPLAKVNSFEQIPAKLKYEFDSKRKTIVTDVVTMSGKFSYQAVYNPGDILQDAMTGINATVGAIARHSVHGKVLVSAGHFGNDVGGKGSVVQLHDNSTRGSAVSCEIADSKLDEYVDYSFLQPRAEQSGSEFNLVDSQLTSAYFPTAKIDLKLQLYVIARAEALPVTCMGINMYHPVSSQFVLRNLIITNCVTQAGDSGAALVDRYFRIWGFLRGAIGNQFSVFMPAVSILSRENLQFGG